MDIKTKIKKITTRILSFPYIIWMLAFIILPLILIVYFALFSKDGGFTLKNLSLIASPVNRKALYLSLRLSLISTFICLVLAYPLALILDKINLKNKNFVVLILILPMWMNFLLRTIAWQNILEGTGILNTVLKFFNLPLLNIINTPAAIVLGMVYNFLPFMILPIYNSLDKIDKDVVFAAKDLGANSLQTFLKVIFPLSLPGVISGFTMVFVPSLTTFVISTILGGSKIILIGNIIEQEFRIGNWHAGSGLSLVLMFFVVISMAAITRFDDKKGGSLI